MANEKLFTHQSLQEFFIVEELIQFRDEDLIALDAEVADYESARPNDIRQALINRNEIMSSYAISQAEKSSSVTPRIANEIRSHYESDPSLAYTASAGSIKEIEDNFDRQEFLNILKTFRWISANGLKRDDLSLDVLVDIHQKLTFQLDSFRGRFFDVLPEVVAQSKSAEGKFHWYYPGQYRSADSTVVGKYKPVGHEDVRTAVEDVILFYKKEPSLKNLNIFTGVLYAIHPFSNGNKRLCRILEHALMRDIGLNRRNIYGHAYYYYRELERFYENLARSLETKNLCPIVNYAREGIFFSMLMVYESGIKSRREAFIKDMIAKKRYGGKAKLLNGLVKIKEMGFADVKKEYGKKLSKRSFINYLNTFLKDGVIVKKKIGRETYYKLNLELAEEQVIRESILKTRYDLPYVPRRLSNTVLQID